VHTSNSFNFYSNKITNNEKIKKSVDFFVWKREFTERKFPIIAGNCGKILYTSDIQSIYDI
jgi:hypothetical protein